MAACLLYVRGQWYPQHNDSGLCCTCRYWKVLQYPTVQLQLFNISKTLWLLSPVTPTTPHHIITCFLTRCARPPTPATLPPASHHAHYLLRPLCPAMSSLCVWVLTFTHWLTHTHAHSLWVSHSIEFLHTHDETLANNSEKEVKKAPPPPLWWIYWLARDTLHTWETQGVFCLPFPKEQTQPLPVYHPNPGESRLACQLTEEEQIRIAQRIGLIQHLPKGIFDPGSDSSEKKVKE